DVDEAIKKRSFRVIALYSRNSLKHQEVMRQRALALSVCDDYTDDFLIPLNVDSVTPSDLDRKTGLLQFVPFANWAHGFGQLLKKLHGVQCPQPLIDGKSIASEVFLATNTLSLEGETLVSNCLQIQRIPHVIYRLRAVQAVPTKDLYRLRLVWPFRQIASD